MRPLPLEKQGWVIIQVHVQMRMGPVALADYPQARMQLT